MKEELFRQIVSGQARGIVASAARGLLHVLSWPYRCYMRVRNGLFDSGIRKQHRVDVPVIAVGNITTGGTGKTPVVAWIVQQLQQSGLSPGIVSRGYGADSTGTNDEKRVLDLLCPGVPHEQNPDRVAAARKLISQHDVSVIVLDDAFQHRRIARELNIVLIDATNPFGYGYTLPRGLLREPIRSLQRADVVLITRADAVDDHDLSAITETVQKAVPQRKDSICGVAFQPTSVLLKSGETQTPEFVRGRKAVIMTGIGNPAAFAASCRQIGVTPVAERFFPDHHHYTDQDINDVCRLADESDASLVLTTLKDMVKISAGDDRITAVLIETVFKNPSDEMKVRDKLAAAAKISIRSHPTDSDFKSSR